MYMHNFLIHSSGDGHPGCVRVLAVVNGAAMHVAVRVFFNSGFLQGMCSCRAAKETQAF